MVPPQKTVLMSFDCSLYITTPSRSHYHNFKFFGVSVMAPQSIWTSVMARTITASSFLGCVWWHIKFFGAVWDSILSFFPTACDGILIFFGDVWDGILSFFGAVWDGILSLFGAVCNGTELSHSVVIIGRLLCTFRVRVPVRPNPTKWSRHDISHVGTHSTVWTRTTIISYLYFILIIVSLQMSTLLAPSGALVVMMCYYISSRPLFEILSIRAFL